MFCLILKQQTINNKIETCVATVQPSSSLQLEDNPSSDSESSTRYACIWNQIWTTKEFSKCSISTKSQVPNISHRPTTKK